MGFLFLGWQQLSAATITRTPVNTKALVWRFDIFLYLLHCTVPVRLGFFHVTFGLGNFCGCVVVVLTHMLRILRTIHKVLRFRLFGFAQRSDGVSVRRCVAIVAGNRTPFNVSTAQQFSFPAVFDRIQKNAFVAFKELEQYISRNLAQVFDRFT